MGAHLVDYGVLQDSWDKFTLINNPRSLNQNYARKGGVEFEDAAGNYDGWRKGTRLHFPMDFSRIAGDEAQRQMIQHFSEREPSPELDYTQEECKFRISKRQTTYYGRGNDVTIDATAKTLTHAGASYGINSRKGYFCAVIFHDGVSASISASAKTVTDSTKHWNTDEFTGYFFPYNGYYYYILSNTATVLTLSDPNGTLIDNVNFDYDIVKNFKIIKNTPTVLTLRDDDDELIDGTWFNYYIDFSEMRSIGNDFGFNQDLYNDEDEDTKMDYSIEYAEVD